MNAASIPIWGDKNTIDIMTKWNVASINSCTNHVLDGDSTDV